MTEVLNLNEQIAIAVSLAEGQFREFKSALQGPPGQKVKRSVKEICRDVGEALVAFANADGGELIIGVEDDGALTGTEELSPQDVASVKAAPTTHVHPDTPLESVLCREATISGRRLIYFRVAKGTHQIHLTSDGRCMRRNDLESKPVASEQIKFQRQEVRSREYDREFVDGVSVADLDQNLLRIVADQVSAGISIDKCLQYLGLAEYDSGSGLRLRRAAVLLFATSCDRWHPRVQVRILKVKGMSLGAGASYNVANDVTVKANIIRLVDEAWDELRPHLAETRFQEDARFRTTLIYPEVACREALVNAIAHRDYSEEGRGIEIYVFEDRIEVVNPGSLLSSISLSDITSLRGAHQSRNSFIARALREVGVMRELGEGMRRIHDLMASNELAPPDIFSEDTTFRLALHHRPMYSRNEALWLSQYDALSLTAEEKAIILLGRSGELISPNEIINRLGIVDIERYRQLLELLQRKGILVNTIPKKSLQAAVKRKGVVARDVSRFKIIPFADVTAPKTDNRSARSVSAKSSSDSKKPERESAKNFDDSAVYIGNIPPNTTQLDLVYAFRDIGVLNNTRIPQSDGLSRGYAFATFEDSAAAALAVKSSVNMGGRSLVIRWATPRTKRVAE